MPSDAAGGRLTVGIAVPFYSGLTYLETALCSLIAQTDRAWTAVVVDDASPEPGAAELVARLADDRITATRNERNLGVAANFNRCLELVEAEIAVIFHADDEMEPSFVAALRAAHSRNPLAACVASQVTVIDSSGTVIRPLADRVKSMLWPYPHREHVLAGDRGLARTLAGQFWYCPAVSYRPSLLPESRFDPRWRQVMDLDLYGRVLLSGGSIVLLAERTYRYRRHENAETRVNSLSLLRFEEEAAVHRELALFAARMGWDRAARAGRWRFTSRSHCLLTAARLFASLRLRSAARVAKLGLGR